MSQVSASKTRNSPYKYTIKILALLITSLFFISCLKNGSSTSASPSAGNVPDSVENFSISAISNNSVLLNWDSNSLVTSYQLLYGLDASVTNETATVLSDVSPPYLIEGLTNGATYYFRVAAVNSAGTSELSPTFSAIPIPAPTNLAAASGNAQNSISWNAVTDADSYNLYFSVTPSLGLSGTKVSSVTSPYVHTPLTNGVSYFYVVTAVKGALETIASSEQNATPQGPPASPGNLAAAIGDGNLNLSWDNSAGATSYNIYFATSSSQGTSGTKLANVTPPYSHTGLVNGTTYYYVVTAESAAGESSASAEQSGQPVAIPSAPLGLSATSGAAQVSLSWSASAGASGYDLYFATSSGQGTSGTKLANVTSPYSHTGLANGTTYYYVVTAKSAAGSSSASAEDSAIPIAIPSTPAGLTIATGDTSLALTWSPSTGASSYDLYFATSSGQGTSGTKLANVTSPYSHTGLVNGTTYYYVVSASNTSGESTESSEVSNTPVAVPATPTGLAVGGGDTQSTVSWNASAGASGYDLYFATSSGQGTSGTKLTSVTSPYSHTGLVNGTTYYYVVSASSAAGESAISGEQSITPLASPAVPSGLVVTPGNAQTSVSWNAASGATSYNLYFATSSGQGTSGTKLANVTSPYSHTALVNGTTYYYVVTSQNSTAESAASSESSAMPNTPPAAPNSTRVVKGDGAATVYWDLVSGATSYNVYYSTPGNPTTGSAKLTGVNPGVIVSSLVNNSSYRFSATAVNSAGESTLSIIISSSIAIPKAPITNYKQVTVGDRFMCGIAITGKAYCYGQNGLGQLGNGLVVANTTAPQNEVSGGYEWLQLSAGKDFVCGITTEGKLYCWGNNDEAQLGRGTGTAGSSYNTPQLVDTTKTFVTVAAGDNYVCGIETDGFLYCWGDDDLAQYGLTASGNGYLESPTKIGGVSDKYEKVAVASEHTCAIRQGRTQAQCWGDDTNGELGDGASNNSLVQVIAYYIDIAVSANSSCAITKDRSIKCWGDDTDGELADGSSSSADQTTPVATDVSGMSGSTQFTSIVGGDNFFCATTTDGEAHCWGDDLYNQIGDTVTGDQIVPKNLAINSTVNNIQQLTGGYHSGCFLRTDGVIECWGWGFESVGRTTVSTTFSPAADLFEQVSSGHQFSCGLLGRGEVACWGNDSEGQLGNDDLLVSFNQPKMINRPFYSYNNFKQVVTGYAHACALHGDGAVQCWGRNTQGQLGRGTISSSEPSPAVISGAYKFLNLAAGDNHTCGVTDDQKIYCWGANESGQLGDTSTTDSNIPVLATTGGTEPLWESVAAGKSHTLAKASGAFPNAYTWGSDSDGQLGFLATTIDQTSVTSIGSSLDSVYAGGLSSAALSTIDDYYFYTGDASNVQSGQSTTTDFQQFNGVTISGGVKFRDLSFGINNGCGVSMAGQIYCWGQDGSEQLGNGSGGALSLAKDTHQLISGSLYAIQPSVGTDHTCHLLDTGFIHCSGANASGQIGVGTSTATYDTPSTAVIMNGL